MALPTAGVISIGNVNTELGAAANAARSLGTASTRNLFGIASGLIKLSNGYGKANLFAFTIASNQINANLRTLAINAGWNQSSKVLATVNSGIYLSSNSTGIAALIVDGSFPGGVELRNNGIIVGRGGNGGNGQFGTAGAFSGGAALSVSVALAVNNGGTLAGGGGGGSGGPLASVTDACGRSEAGGGGGGGGRSSAAANSAGGAGGAGGADGAAGGAGTLSGPGGGGAGGVNGPATGGSGAAGGQWGASGGSGGWGGPGAGGAAVLGSSNITWLATGTRLGAIS